MKDLGIKMLVVDLDRRQVPIEILNFKNYEEIEVSTTFKIIKKLSKKKINFFDIGSNHGFYSLCIYAKFLKKKNINIFSFEPVKKIYDVLNKNIELNKFSKKIIKAHCLGFSNDNKNVKFFHNAAGSGNSSMKKFSSGSVPTICKVLKLDTFCKQKKTIPDFVKIDTEGSEALVVQGGNNVIQKYKPVFLIEILRKWSFDQNYNKVIELFIENNYIIFSFLPRGLKEISRITEKTKATNFLFLEKIKHKSIISQLR